MAYCKNCGGRVEEQDIIEERNNVKKTYHIVFCTDCGLEIKRTFLSEEDIIPDEPPQIPKDPKWDKWW